MNDIEIKNVVSIRIFTIPPHARVFCKKSTKEGEKRKRARTEASELDTTNEKE